MMMSMIAQTAWAEAQPGYINYDDLQTTGGWLYFFSTEAAAFANNLNPSEGYIHIPTDVKKSTAQYSGTIYIRALHYGYGYTVNGMTINVTPSGDGDAITVTPVEGHTGVYKFDMPDGKDVTVTAAFAENHKVETTYIDADGTEKTVQAFPLDGAEDQLGAFETKWYVARGNVAYDHTLNIYGDYQDNVHIILADGCNMTVTAAYTAIEFASYDLTLNIYGQSGDTGSLTATGTGSGLTYGIGKYANEATADLIINGGQVTANGGTGIEATNVTINGGQVTSTGSSNGISAGNDITINGGQVTSNGDIYADNITLGWKNATDFIKATRYFVDGTVSVKTGQAFLTDDTTPEIVFASVSDPSAINNKKLSPCYAYVDENGVMQKKLPNEVTVLTGGGATNLDAGWYIAQGEVNYTGTIILQGEVHLILADGCQMNIGTSESPIDNPGMYSNAGAGQSLTIYGQSGGTGALNVDVTGGYSAIGVQNVTINGGKVTAIGTTGISAIDNVTINGGQVTATGSNGIIAINGDIILGWTSLTDLINARNYNVGEGKAVKTADGKALKYADGDNTVKLIGTVSDVDALSGKTLTPYGYGGYCGKDNTETDEDESKDLTWNIALKDDATSANDLNRVLTIEGTGDMADYSGATNAPWKNYDLSLILVANEVAYNTYKASLNANDKAKLAPAVIIVTAYEGWATFCHNYPVAYRLSDGTTAHTISGLSDDGKSITISDAIANGVIPATPLLINGNSGSIIMFSAPETATALESTEALASKSGTNVITYGNAGNTGLEAGDCTGIINPEGYTSYVLRNGQFIRVDENTGLAAHRCVLNVANSTANNARVLMIRQNTTSLSPNPSPKGEGSEYFYTLDGRRINGKPATKGVYIQGGKKRVVK